MLGDEQTKPVTKVTIICEDGETHRGWLSEHLGHNGIRKVRIAGPTTSWMTVGEKTTMVINSDQ